MYLKRLPRSQLSRREREFRSFSLMLRDENKNFFLLISCFETRTRKQKMKVILTGIPGIENSRPALKLNPWMSSTLKVANFHAASEIIGREEIFS